MFKGVPTGNGGISKVKSAIGYFCVRDDSALDRCVMGCTFLSGSVTYAVGIAALHELAVFDISPFWLATLSVIHVEYALAQVGDMGPPAAEVKGWLHLASSWIKASIRWKAWYMRLLVLSKSDITLVSWLMDRTIARYDGA